MKASLDSTLLRAGGKNCAILATFSSIRHVGDELGGKVLSGDQPRRRRWPPGR